MSTVSFRFQWSWMRFGWVQRNHESHRYVECDTIHYHLLWIGHCQVLFDVSPGSLFIIVLMCCPFRNPEVESTSTSYWLSIKFVCSWYLESLWDKIKWHCQEFGVNRRKLNKHKFQMRMGQKHRPFTQSDCNKILCLWTKYSSGVLCLRDQERSKWVHVSSVKAHARSICGLWLC